MTLMHIEVKNAQKKAKTYKILFKGRLFRLVNPSGSKLWQFKYRIYNREKQLYNPPDSINHKIILVNVDKPWLPG